MRDVFLWLFEFALVVIQFPSNILKLVKAFDTVSSRSPGATIILTERWFSKNPFHVFGKKYLEEQGFQVYSLNYSIVKGTFEDSAKHLENFIQQHRLQNVILVGISAGSTTCLEYLQHRNGWENTKKFISISGSMYGSPLAYCFPFFKSVRELFPNSSYIKRLHQKPIKNLSKIVTISAKHDNMVPSFSSRLHGAQNITLNVVGHNVLHTFWKPTYELVSKLAKE